MIMMIMRMMRMVMMMMMIDITGHLRLEICNCATCGGAFGLRNFSSNLNVHLYSPTYEVQTTAPPNVNHTAQCHRLYLNCEVTSPSAPHTIAFTVGVCITKAMNRLLSALLRKTKVQHAWLLFSHHDKSSSYICTHMHMCTYMHLCTYATY